MAIKFDELWMNVAVEISKKSKDERTKVGCVLVDKNNIIISTGYNGNCRGDDDSQKFSPEDKALYVEHAERNAIYNAARVGRSCDGAIAYTTFSPCVDCGRALIQSGIKKIIVPKIKNKEERHRKWEELQEKSRELMEKLGLEYVVLEDYFI